MKDIVATALDSARQQPDASSSADAGEFGLPRFCYIGCGSWGCQRVAGGLADRSYDSPPQLPLQELTTNICVGDREAMPPVRADEWVGHDAVRNGECDGCHDQLAIDATDADICLLALSLTDATAAATAVTLARNAEETPVLVFAATDGEHEDGTLQRLAAAANTTLLFDEAVVRGGPLGTAATPASELVARLVREFVTDAVELPTISSAIGTRYPRVASRWDTGGLAIPSLARLSSETTTASTLRESLLPLARTSMQTEAWVGYVVGGEQFTLDEFNRLRTALRATVGERAAEEGVLAGRIHPDLDDARYLTLLRMVGDRS